MARPGRERECVLYSKEDDGKNKKRAGKGSEREKEPVEENQHARTTDRLKGERAPPRKRELRISSKGVLDLICARTTFAGPSTPYLTYYLGTCDRSDCASCCRACLPGCLDARMWSSTWTRLSPCCVQPIKVQILGWLHLEIYLSRTWTLICVPGRYPCTLSGTLPGQCSIKTVFNVFIVRDSHDSTG